MDLNKFDKLFKSALENLEEPYDTSGWPEMENRLNAVFSEEHPAPVESVDLTVKRALDHLEAPYQHGDWQILSARLNQIALVRRIRITKLAEAAIFLLLLANIEGFLGGFKEVVKPAAPAAPPVSVPMAKNGANSHSRRGVTTLQAGIAEKQGVSLADEMAALVAATFNNNPQLAEDAATASFHPDDTAIPAAASMLDEHNFYDHSGITRFDLLSPVPTRNAVLMADAYSPQLPAEIAAVITRKKSGLYAGSYVAYAHNQIVSNGYHTSQNAAGAGMKIGLRKGVWGVETGLAYSNTRFTPKRVEKIYAGNPVDGFLASYIKQADGDVFMIPVKVTRRIAKAGKASLHAVAGVTANIVAEKSYQYRRVVYPPASSSSGGSNVDLTQYSIPDKRQEGALEGGSVAANTYVTADLGLRLEAPVGKHYVAFIEPSYRRALNGGFGPEREKIHSFTIQAGVMASL